MVQQIPPTSAKSHLLGSRLFEGIAPELVGEIGSYMDLMSFQAGEVIFREGEPGDCFYLVCDGVVCISKLGRAGKQETLGYIKPREFFGEMAVIDGQPRSALAYAAEPTLVGRVDRENLEPILAIAPREMHMNFLRSVVQRLRQADSKFIAELLRTERLALAGNMIDSVVNEFKNPLCVLRSCMDSLRSSLVDPELLKITEVMARAAESMIDRTEEILEFTAGQESLKIESIPLRSLAEQLEERARKILPDAIELTLELEFEFERDTAVQGDPTRLLRMFMSLVKNAIESMPDGGSLHVSVQRRGSQAAFLISDSGCGISPELHARIFEPFVSHGNEGGSGLGMATVKRVVEAHGGTVSLRSEPGLGTEVEVRLPTTL